MAFGCDSEAHRGALEAGGATIAVMGCGADICYPSSNEALWKKILRRGLILSEYPPGTKTAALYISAAKPDYQRNFRGCGCSGGGTVQRISDYSGLCGGTGEDAFAVPGNISASNSIGCNKLIQDGAVPVALSMISSPA